MTTLINKSNHPVYIKRINVRVWTLRDEIEACIQARIDEHGADNVDIEDIKSFYSSLVPRNKSFDDLAEEEFEEQNHQPGIEDTADIDDDSSESEQAQDPEENPENQSSESGEEEGGEEEAKAGEMADELISDAAEGEGQNGQEATKQEGFKRVIPPESKMVYGFAFLSEIHMDQLLFFGKRPYTNGQSIVIEFLIPNRFSVSAEVLGNLHIDRNSRIISETKPSHRVQGKFTFLFDGERGSLRDFLKSVEPSVPPPPKRLKKQDTDGDDDDDFDDLGF